MKHTTNLNLAKYDISDKFNITQSTNSLNDNMDIIDDAFKELDDAVNNVATEEETQEIISAYGT